MQRAHAFENTFVALTDSFQGAAQVQCQIRPAPFDGEKVIVAEHLDEFGGADEMGLRLLRTPLQVQGMREVEFR